MAVTSESVHPFTSAYRWHNDLLTYHQLHRPLSTSVIDFGHVINDNKHKSLYDEYDIRDQQQNNVFTRPIVFNGLLLTIQVCIGVMKRTSTRI